MFGLLITLNSSQDRPIIIAEPQQKKLDLIKKLSEDYPIDGGALCTGNKACPIIDKNGEISLQNYNLTS